MRKICTPKFLWHRSVVSTVNTDGERFLPTNNMKGGQFEIDVLLSGRERREAPAKGCARRASGAVSTRWWGSRLHSSRADKKHSGSRLKREELCG